MRVSAGKWLHFHSESGPSPPWPSKEQLLSAFLWGTGALTDTWVGLWWLMEGGVCVCVLGVVVHRKSDAGSGSWLGSIIGLLAILGLVSSSLWASPGLTSESGG